jgi:hypothetical protein
MQNYRELSKKRGMPDKSRPNYPDILGYITDDISYTRGVVDFALAVRPQTVRAGELLSVILLMQNTSDATATVTSTLQLPSPARGRMGEFTAISKRLTLNLRPAEVGYAELPVMTPPDASTDTNYSISMKVDAKAQGRARRIRYPADREAVNFSYYFYLTEEALAELATLKTLHFSGAQMGLFDSVLKSTFKVAAARTSQPRAMNPKPAWVSLWSLSDHTDARPLLERYGEALQWNIFPEIEQTPPETLYKLLRRSTRAYIKKSGYPVYPIELHFITKLLLWVIYKELDTEQPTSVAALLQRGWSTDGSPIPLPNWCRGMLRLAGLDRHAVDQPAKALSRALYSELLRDGVVHGFRMLHSSIEETLGAEHEIHKYGNQLVHTFWHGSNPVTFVDLYLPLVLGGVLVDQRVFLPDESVAEALHTLLTVVEQRAPERTPDNTSIFQIVDKVIGQALQKYGYHHN